MKIMKLMIAVAALALISQAAQADDTASISGKVIFEGKAPKVKKIDVAGDPQCLAMHADSPLTNEEVIVNDNGTLRNVFIYVKSGLEGKTFEVPKEPVKIDQIGCHYVPHVFGMQAKQLLLIHNGDPLTHNIHAVPTNNDEYNKPQIAGSDDLKKTFTKPEVMIKFKCEVHPWMSAYVGVVDNPFYAVTGADGTFSLKGLPPGDYEISAVHEKYGEQSIKVKVGAGEAKTAVDFTFKKPE